MGAAEGGGGFGDIPCSEGRGRVKLQRVEGMTRPTARGEWGVADSPREAAPKAPAALAAPGS